MLGPATIHADPLGLLVAFGAGMLSFLSPCVLPLVPAYLSMVSGLSAAELSALHPVRPPEPERQPVPAALTVPAGPPGAAEGALPSDRPEPVPPAASPSGAGPTAADLARER